MSIKTFSSIYIGSFEVTMKIFEISSKKKLREIDYIRSRLDLGKEAYKHDNKSIGYECVDELCDMLSEFRTIMNGYKVDSYEIYASSFFDSVSNKMFVLDQVYIRTGFQINVINNVTHRFISYKSLVNNEAFAKLVKKSAIVVDIGGASVQVTFFNNGKLESTQHMEIGTVKLRELLYNPGNTENTYRSDMEEYIDKKIKAYTHLYFEQTVDYVIFMNDNGMELIQRLEKDNEENNLIKADKLYKYLEKLQRKSLSDISEVLSLPDDSDSLLIPTICLFKAFISNLQPKDVWIAGVNINDGIAYDYAQKNRLIRMTHNFDDDVISAAKKLSERFCSYSLHIEALTGLSIQIFDAMKKVHGLGSRERLLLQTATILHDCGKFISLENDAMCAYNIIKSSEIIGLVQSEREIVARTVLYNSYKLDNYEDVSDVLGMKEYVISAKLAAILRVANALDQSHKQKFTNIKFTLKDKQLIIHLETFDDISLEKRLFEEKTAFFEEIFSIKPIIKSKKIYNLGGN